MPRGITQFEVHAVVMCACISALVAPSKLQTYRPHCTAVSTDMEEETLAPFGLVEVLDKFHVATVTIQRACVYTR